MRLALRLTSNGPILFCYGSTTETYRAILDRLNKYRGPENQLRALFDYDGLLLDLDKGLHVHDTTTYKTLVT